MLYWDTGPVTIAPQQLASHLAYSDLVNRRGKVTWLSQKKEGQG